MVEHPSRITQRQVTHAVPLPACRNGHPARHIHDQRRLESNGGHFIECRCCNSGRHATFEEALQDWHRRNGRRGPRRQEPAAADNIVQLDLLRVQGGPRR